MQTNTEAARRESTDMETRRYEAASGLRGYGNCGAQMGGQPKTFRLALGLFSELQALCDVLSDLAELGLEGDCLCLLCQAELVNSSHWKMNIAELAARHRSLLEDFNETQGLFDIRCLVSSGQLLDDLSNDSQPRLSWMPEVQLKRLETHLCNGGVVLIVSSVTPAQQNAASRALLRRSQNGVLTHDFTLGTADSAPTAVTNRSGT